MTDLDELIAEAKEFDRHPCDPQENYLIHRLADALESVRAERDAALARIAELERKRDNAEMQVEIRANDSIAARIARQNVRAVEEWAATQERLKSLDALVTKQQRYIEELENVDGAGLKARAEQAEARIAEAAKLHRESEAYRETCAGCSVGENLVDWPCPTAVSLGLNEGENDD